MTDFSEQHIAWRKSSYSTDGGNCVEVAPLANGRIAMRDSKDPSGPMLVFDSEAFSKFTAAIKDGSLLH
ncbi:DUF397 domain-containing protein [Nonomuraea sp. NPDC049649]|uniref:DUF397 domain-containing protein n=1 Tax=Nonomuraea sp. NPDC049649 TaxID=3155776 RepID=UPI003432065B